MLAVSSVKNRVGYLLLNHVFPRSFLYQNVKKSQCLNAITVQFNSF